MTVDALVVIYTQLIKRNSIEESINGTQRAEVFAERPPDDQSQQNADSQNREFPEKDSAKQRTDGAVRNSQHAAGKSAGGAKTLAEEGNPREYEGECQRQDEEQVFQPTKRLISLETVCSDRERNQMNQLLKPPHGA